MTATWTLAEHLRLLGDRRGETRVQSSGAGKLTVITPSRVESLDVDVLDVSRCGLQVEVDALVEAGSLVELQLSALSVLGEVTWSQPIGSGRYRIGVSIGRLIDLP